MNLYLAPEGLLRHEAVTGKSGSGKSEYLLWRLSQQIKLGGGAFVLDAKTDYGFRHRLWNLARACAREHDLRCVNIDDGANSNTYNPLLRGDAVAVASRFTETLDVGGSATAEHFRAQGHLALTAAMTAIKTLDLAYNAADLYVVLSHPPAMQWLLQSTRGERERSSYAAWLQPYCQTERGVMRINLQALRQQIGGVASRLFVYGTGEIGRVMGAYAPEVDLLDCIDNNHIVYLMLPALEKNEAALAFARLFFSDLRSALAALYKRPRAGRPRVPFMVALDEFGSYASRVVAPTFEMARGAGVALMPIFQTYANLRNVSEEFADQIVGNTEVSTFFCVGDPNTAEFAARLFGQARRAFAAHSATESDSDQNRNLALGLFHPIARSRSRGIAWREAYDHRVRPEELMELPPGHAFVRVKSANSAFKLCTPMIRPPQGSGFTHAGYATGARPGLDLMQRFAGAMRAGDENPAPPR